MDNLKKKEIPMISAIPELGFATGLSGLLGMINGGLKEASASPKLMEMRAYRLMMRESSANPNKDTKILMEMLECRFMRESTDASGKRYQRVVRGSFVGGVRLAMVGAVFSGMQTWLAEKRGVHDLYNIVAASSGTAAACGLIMPGSLISRASNGLMAAACIPIIAFPLGWIHLELSKN